MRPLSGILSTQLVLRIGRRMTNADHRIHQSELSALKPALRHKAVSAELEVLMRSVGLNDAGICSQHRKAFGRTAT